MVLTCALSMGLPVWVAGFQSPLRPSSSNSLDKCDLVLDKLPGAAISSPLFVMEPAWFGSQCCVKYTRMSSGMAVCRILLHASCLLCSQLVSSLMAACLIFIVSGFTACFWSSAAAAKPLPYRSATVCWLCWVALELLATVAHTLEYTFVRLAASRLGGACSINMRLEELLRPVNAWISLVLMVVPAGHGFAANTIAAWGVSCSCTW